MLPEDNSSVQIAVQYLETLHSEIHAGDSIELRLKVPDNNGPMHRTFLPTAEEAAEVAVSQGRTCDVYAGVATRRGEDGTKKGVCSASAVWADLDAKGGHTRESRLEQLMVLPCHPSMLVWSGAGWHVYYLLMTPAESPEEMDRAELIMRRLAAGLGSDSVHDRSRILRVPATCNLKYGEPRLVEMELCEPGRRYELDRLQGMAESLAVGSGDSASGGSTTPREVLAEPIREGKRNVARASVAGSLRNRGLDAATILDVLIQANFRRCVPPLEDVEVAQIAYSIARYPAGQPRYRRSPVRRIRREKKEG
jgi:hypothetical protein